jgi:riboflavin transporter FmnP
MNHKKVNRMVFLAIMASLSIIIHFVESLFPLPGALPGIKLGLSNTVSLIVLYIYGPVSAFVILIKSCNVSCIKFRKYGGSIKTMSKLDFFFPNSFITEAALQQYTSALSKNPVLSRFSDIIRQQFLFESTNTA